MNSVLPIVAVTISAIFVGSVRSLTERRTIWTGLQVLGAICLTVVVLAHIAEKTRIWPEMGWGLPNSTGHYVDLVSAIAGSIILPLGFIVDLMVRPKSELSKWPT